MGFYIRKSLSVGPLRFNLSKSGIGVSTGIKGFRVGSGPRGNYIQMGRGGFYYRQTLPSSHTNDVARPDVPENETSDINFVEIESGRVNSMVDSSSVTLLDEIDSKAKKWRIWPWAFGLSLCLFLLLIFENSPVWAYFLTSPLCACGIIWSVYTDKMRKTVVLFYDLEPHIDEAFQNLHNAFDLLRSCSRIWHIQVKGNITTTHDWKVHAGANAIVKRKAINPFAGSPPYFKCNVKIPVLPAAGQKLFFLPDRILVWHTNGVGAVSFDHLEVSIDEQPFIESDSVPSDARIINKTWRYVNKTGGPDKRFNNNRELPIVLYEEILLSSKSGLKELIQTSKTGVGQQLNSAIKQMASAISVQEEPKPEAGYIKCPCNNCDIFIEFPVGGIGQTVACPHCHLDTVLFQPVKA